MTQRVGLRSLLGTDDGCNKERERCWQVERAYGQYRYGTESQKQNGRTPKEYFASCLPAVGEPKGQQGNAGQHDWHKQQEDNL